MIFHLKPIRYLIWDEIVAQVKGVGSSLRGLRHRWRWAVLDRRMEVFNFHREEAAEELLAEPRLDAKVASQVLLYLGDEQVSQRPLDYLMRHWQIDHRMVMKLLLWATEQKQEPPELNERELDVVQAAYERALQDNQHRRSYIQIVAQYALAA